jgi:hypothetical protein
MKIKKGGLKVCEPILSHWTVPFECDNLTSCELDSLFVREVHLTLVMGIMHFSQCARLVLFKDVELIPNKKKNVVKYFFLAEGNWGL